VHSTNVPKAPSLDYYIVTLEWMQKIYVKFFDGTAIPYGADAYKHMTLPFFSIFQPQLFQDEDGNSGAPDPEMFNSHPEELWSLFFRAFLFAALFEGFDAYIKERDALYRKQYLAQNPNNTESRTINQIRPRSTLETRYESAMKSGLLLVQSMDFDDVKENGLYVQNQKELFGLFKKCDIRLDSMDDPSTAIEKILLLLWGKTLNLYNQNKNDPYPTEENLESRLQQSVEIITNAQAELQARVKGVWEAYVCFNLPNLDFPQTQTPLKDYVRFAKTNLVFYLDKEPKPFPLPTQKSSIEETPVVDVVDKEAGTTPFPVLKEGTSTESDSILYIGLAVGALLLGGGFYFLSQKQQK